MKRLTIASIQLVTRFIRNLFIMVELALIRTLIVCILFFISVRSMSVSPPSDNYTLKPTFQGSAQILVKLQCVEANTGTLSVNLNKVIFWLNRENATDAGLRERDDVTVTETEDQLGIMFNLTRDLEGYYTCGRRIDSNNVRESPKVTLICKYNISHIISCMLFIYVLHNLAFFNNMIFANRYSTSVCCASTRLICINIHRYTW